MPDMVNTQMVGATPAADVPDAPVVTVDTASIATTLALTTLDASGSSDPAGGSLSFAWTMDTKPTGSAAALSGSATATETFTPDKSGTYSGSATATSSVTGKSAATRWVRRVRGALSAAFGSDSYQQADTTAITGLATQLGGLTVSGGVTPYTYSWAINGAATGLSDATAADPNVTVTALDGGTLVNARHAVECTVTDAAGNTATAAGWVEIGDASLGSGGPAATVGGSTALWAALTVQDGVTALSLSATAVTAGATLQWTVYGPTNSDETAQLITSGDTTATPTWAAFSAASGRIAGNWSVRLDVTAGGLTTTYTRTVRVGDVDGLVLVHDADWTAVDHDFQTEGTTVVVDGVTYTSGNEGSASTFAASSGTGLTIGGAAVGCYVDAAADCGGSAGITLAGDVVYYMVLSAGSIAANSDGDLIEYRSTSGAVFAQAEARRDGGAQNIASQATGMGVNDYHATAGGGQVRVLALRRRGYGYEVGYAESYAGTLPAFSTLSRHTGVPGGLYTMDTVLPSETADTLAVATDVARYLRRGSSTTDMVVLRTAVKVRR